MSLDAGLRPVKVERAKTYWVDVPNRVLRIPKDESSKNTENWIVSIQERTAEMLVYIFQVATDVVIDLWRANLSYSRWMFRGLSSAVVLIGAYAVLVARTAGKVGYAVLTGVIDLFRQLSGRKRAGTVVCCRIGRSATRFVGLEAA